MEALQEMDTTMGTKQAKRGRKKPGRHPENVLTATKVKTAKPGSYCDGNCLWLRCDDAGNRTWVLRVVVRGKRRNIGLGSTRLVSLKESREEALTLRKTPGGRPSSRTAAASVAA